MTNEQDESFKTSWRRRFEEFAAANEDDAGIAGWSATGLGARLRSFTRRCTTLRAGSRWLDAGCGAGTYCRVLADRSLEVVGIDYSLLSLLKARQRSHDPIMWIAADATRLPLKRDAFEGAICFGVTQALEASQPLVDALACVVAPGGELWIDGLNAWCIPHVWEQLSRRIGRKPTHTRYEFPYRLRVAFSRAGLRDVRVHWIPILPSRFARYQWMVESKPVGILMRMLPPLSALLSHAFVVRGTKPHARTTTGA